MAQAVGFGWLKDALVPIPFAAPAEPLPANVVTSPVATLTDRIIEVPLSPTNNIPAPHVAIPMGLLNRAKVPNPSEYPSVLDEVDPPPARVAMYGMLPSNANVGREDGRHPRGNSDRRSQVINWWVLVASQ